MLELLLYVSECFFYFSVMNNAMVLYKCCSKSYVITSLVGKSWGLETQFVAAVINIVYKI